LTETNEWDCPGEVRGVSTNFTEKRQKKKRKTKNKNKKERGETGDRRSRVTLEKKEMDGRAAPTKGLCVNHKSRDLRQCGVIRFSFLSKMIKEKRHPVSFVIIQLGGKKGRKCSHLGERG